MTMRPAHSNVTPAIALDVHAHLAPVLLERLAGFDGVSWSSATGKMTVDGHTIGLVKLFQPAALLAWMDQHSIARAWVSIPPPLYRQQLDATAAQRWVDYLNEGLAQVCASYPDRLHAMTYLPLEHAALAAELAQAAVAAGQTRFAVAAGGAPQIVYSDAAYAALWATLDRVDAFVFMHPGTCCDTRLTPFYLENLLGNPLETSVAVAHLVMGGVCDRHPRIRFCLAHAGGATPMLAGRLQRGFDTQRPAVDTTLTPPAAALGRFFADCIAHDPHALRLAAEVFGERHIVFGSDWPFPMGLPEAAGQLDGLDPTFAARVLRDNAVALE